MLKDIFLIIAGALIGLGSTLFVEHKKRLRDKNAQRDYGRQLLKAILEEVKMGIDRCAGLADKISGADPSISFSRVYTGLWDSALPELSKTIEDIEIIRLLDSTYYYFDLVNFNMNRNAFGIGAAFAKDKLPYMKQNFSELEIKLAEIPERVLFNTPVLDRMARMFEQFLRKTFYRSL